MLVSQATPCTISEVSGRVGLSVKLNVAPCIIPTLLPRNTPCSSAPFGAFSLFILEPHPWAGLTEWY